MEQLNGLISWIQAKIDQLFSYFGFYTQNYSKLLVYGLLTFILAKMLKVKVDVKTGGK